jgi:hypothetical protein
VRDCSRTSPYRGSATIPAAPEAVMYARDGVEIEPGARWYWIGSISQPLAPLVDAVRRHWLAARFTRTIRRCRYRLLTMAGPKPGACGSMRAMTVQAAPMRHQRSGLSTRATAAARIRSIFSPRSSVCCRPRLPATPSCIATAVSRRRSAWSTPLD